MDYPQEIREEDKKIFNIIPQFLDDSISKIQAFNFVLNDIEFPTPYAKFQQAKRELINRWSKLMDASYETRETEIKIKMKEREIENEKDDIKRELLELEKEKFHLKLSILKANITSVLKEARIFWEVYSKHPEFQNLSEEEAYKLELETWAQKTMNVPTIFEERYGKEYMKKVLGDENYIKYSELRKKLFGILPREIMEVQNVQGKIQCEDRDNRGVGRKSIE